MDKKQKNILHNYRCSFCTCGCRGSTSRFKKSTDVQNRSLLRKLTILFPKKSPKRLQMKNRRQKLQPMSLPRKNNQRLAVVFICNINLCPMPECRGGGGERFCSRDSRCEYTTQVGKCLQTCDMPKNSASVCSSS